MLQSLSLPEWVAVGALSYACFLFLLWRLFKVAGRS